MTILDGQKWDDLVENAETLVEVLISIFISNLWTENYTERDIETVDHVWSIMPDVGTQPLIPNSFVSSMTFENKELLAKLCSRYDIPDVFWTNTSLKASGYFGCCDSFDNEGNVTGYSKS